MTYLVKDQIINEQHGSVEGNVETNLTSLVQYLHDCLEGDSQVDVVYSDFAKAFDRVHRDLILNKLGQIGILGMMMSCSRSFLTDRQQYVEIGDFRSDSIFVYSGVLTVHV